MTPGARSAAERDLEALRHEFRADAVRALRPAAAQAWERRACGAGNSETCRGAAGAERRRVAAALPRTRGREQYGAAATVPERGGRPSRDAAGRGATGGPGPAPAHDLVLRALRHGPGARAARGGGRASDRGCSRRSPTGPWPNRCISRTRTHRAPRRTSRRVSTRRDRRWPRGARRVARTVRSVLLALKDARAELHGLSEPGIRGRRAAIGRQLDALLAAGLGARYTRPGIGQLPKYLRAAARRAQRLRDDVARDRRLEGEVAPFDLAGRGWLRERRLRHPARSSCAALDDRGVPPVAVSRRTCARSRRSLRSGSSSARARPCQAAGG